MIRLKEGFLLRELSLLNMIPALVMERKIQLILCQTLGHWLRDRDRLIAPIEPESGAQETNARDTLWT
jgi:hypothetical protein